MNLIDYFVLEVFEQPKFTGYGTLWSVKCKTVDMGAEQIEEVTGSYFFCTCVVKKGYIGLH
jgi:hypothetical protein